MASGNGYGRGGRGAALLQLLNNPVRRPGDNADRPPEGAGPSTAVTSSTQPTPLLGRGGGDTSPSTSITRPGDAQKPCVPEIPIESVVSL